MRRMILSLTAVAVVAATVGSVGLASPSLGENISGNLANLMKQSTAPGPSSQPKKETKIVKTVTAEGTLTPVRHGKLGFKMAGRVVEIPLQAGDTLNAGQPIARLESAELDLAVQAAQDNLRMAQALEKQLRQSARTENASIAADNLRAAQARLARLKSGSRPEEIAQAEANLQASEAQLAKLLNGPTSDQLKQADIAIKKAKNNIYYQQATRDSAAGRPMAPITQEQGDALIGLGYEDLALAQAQLDALKEPPREEDVTQARAAVEAARQKLQLVKSPVTEEEIIQAEASVAAASHQSKLASAPYTDGDLAVAQARIKQAETAIEQARLAQTNTVLLAPYAGRVSDVLVRPGEIVQPSQPVINFADLSSLVVKTTDLDEASATKIRVGQRVSVNLNALDDRLVYGRVTAIAPMATITVSEEVNYVATIELDEQDPSLRWGMTAKVEFLRD